MRLNDLSDEELALRARAEPRAVFEVLFERCHAALWNFILMQGVEGARAEDVFQTAVLRAFRAISSFRKETRFKTWLYTIALNVITDEFRVARRRGRSVGLDQADLAVRFAAHDEVKRTETVERAEEALAQLPPEERHLFTLVRFEGLSIPEAARAVGLSPAAAQMKLYRTRRKLGERLALIREKR